MKNLPYNIDALMDNLESEDLHNKLQELIDLQEDVDAQLGIRINRVEKEIERNNKMEHVSVILKTVLDELRLFEDSHIFGFDDFKDKTWGLDENFEVFSQDSMGLCAIGISTYTLLPTKELATEYGKLVKKVAQARKLI